MGWLKRVFGMEKPANASVAPAAKAAAAAPTGETGDQIPACKLGLEGDFDESGMAKRVALAFDNDAALDDIATLWVAQLSSKVVLKGKVPSQDLLDKCVSVAGGVMGATEVDASQVEIG